MSFEKLGISKIVEKPKTTLDGLMDNIKSGSMNIEYIENYIIIDKNGEIKIINDKYIYDNAVVNNVIRGEILTSQKGKKIEEFIISVPKEENPNYKEIKIIGLTKEEFENYNFLDKMTNNENKPKILKDLEKYFTFKIDDYEKFLESNKKIKELNDTLNEMKKLNFINDKIKVLGKDFQGIFMPEHPYYSKLNTFLKSKKENIEKKQKTTKSKNNSPKM